MPSTSIRTATAVRLRDLLALRPECADVEVVFGLPRAAAVGEPSIVVAVGEPGSLERANLTDSRHQRNDRWTLDVFVVLQADADAEEACQRVEDLAGVVQLVLAENPTLMLDGNSLSGLYDTAAESTFEGPAVMAAEGAGLIAGCHLVVNCTARLI